MNEEDGLLDEMLGDFLDESGEILTSLNENLLKLDGYINEVADGEAAKCDDELMNEMFRGAHSLKGLSGMLGLDNICQLTHKVENIFDAARNDQLSLTRNAMEIIFCSIDKITGMIDCITTPSNPEVDCEEVSAQIGVLLQSAGAEHVQESAEETERKFQEMQAAMETSSEPSPAAPEAASAVETDYFADITDESEASAKYMAIFIDEAVQSLDDLDELLINDQEEKDVKALMIQCHKIKGAAASLGLNRAAKLSHYMEDLLQKLEQTQSVLTESMVEALLRCTNTFRNYIKSLKVGQPDTEGFNEVYTLLLHSDKAAAASGEDGAQAAIESPESESAPSATSLEISDAIQEEIQALAPPLGTSWIVQVRLTEGLDLAGLKGKLVHKQLAGLGAIFFCNPPEESMEGLNDLAAITFGVTTLDDNEDFNNQIRLAGVEQVEVQKIDPAAPVKKQSPVVAEAEKKPAPSPVASAAPAPAPQKTPAKKPAPAKPAAKKPAPKQEDSKLAGTNKKPTETLRVDIERLDHLMNLSGQLVINKARLSQIGSSLKSLTTNKQANHSLTDVLGIASRLTREFDDTQGKQTKAIDLENLQSQFRRMQIGLEHVQRGMSQYTQSRTLVSDLIEAVHQMDRVTEGIQKTVMDTRMVPVGPLFRRFKRVIRDITHDNGKDIQLKISGENTELDKRMIDELSDPLIHMIRNCADHGIESPEDRVAVGKPKQGSVTLDAFHCGSSILIEVRDDGKGLDPQKILNKALEKGILTESDAEKLSEHQIFQLIWEPGLSTAEKVTEVSGRGMGMDIVRTKIEDINGTVELDSKVGTGTTITIKLPLTLAILPSLLVEIDGDVIAMPVEAVSEIVRVGSEELSTIHGLSTATVRGRVVSMVNLSELFCWNQPPAKTTHTETEEQSIVILESDGSELGLVVDRLLGEEDIVIKSIDENYRNVAGIAGASILGDGRVSLILDVGSVLEMSTRRNSHAN